MLGNITRHLLKLGKNKNLLGKSTIGKIIPSWRSQDIDYLYQWESAIKIYGNKR